MDDVRRITLRDEVVIAWRIARLRLRGQISYRSSFWMQLFGNFLVNAAEILVLFVMFSHFDRLGGWSLGEVALLHGLAMLAFSIGETLTTGIGTVASQIRLGEFDRTLLRPVNSWIISAVNEVSLRHLGQTIQGAIILAYAVAVLEVRWSIDKIAVAVLAVLLGIALYAALFTVEAILSFWTVNGVEAVNAFTYGGSDLTQYPMHIYQGWMRVFFIWIIPAGFVSYYPALYILDRPDPLGGPWWMVLLGPVVVAVFCAIVGWGWQQAIRHYRSTGS